MPVDGVLEPLTAVTPAQLAVLTLKSPIVTVALTPLENGAGVAFRYEESWALTPAPAAPLPADAGDLRHFSAFVEQDGRRQALEGVVHLKKRPFAFVFTGSRAMAYAVVATADEHVLAGNTTEAQLQEVMARFGAFIEGDDSTFLIVNAAPPGPNGFLSHHHWADSAEDGVHRLGQRVSGPEGLVTGAHRIDRLVLPDALAPIEQWEGRRLYVLVTRKPPLPGDPNVDPKYAVLAFD